MRGIISSMVMWHSLEESKGPRYLNHVLVSKVQLISVTSVWVLFLS